MTIIPEGWAQVALKFGGLNLPKGGAIVFGVQNVGEFNALQVGSYVWEAFAPVVTNCMTPDVQLNAIDVKLGPNETGAIATYSATPVVGTVGGNSLSPGSAILVEKTSLFGGRRSRGRMYLPGVYETWVDDDGSLIAGAISAVNTRCATMLALLNTRSVPMALLHSPGYTWEIVGGQPRRIYGAPGGVPVPYLVQSMQCDPKVATQRRRLR